MKNGRWRVVALAGVSAGALAVLLVPGCGSSDNSKKAPAKFHPDGGGEAGETGEPSGGSAGTASVAGSGGSAGSKTTAGGEAGVSNGGASGAAEAGAGGEATVLTGCALGDACCASNQCESGLNCLGTVCSCVAALHNDYLLRTDGVAFYTVVNDSAQSVVVNGDTGKPLHGIVSIMGSWYHGCAVTNTGDVRCWPLAANTDGNNSGQLGNGTVGGVFPALVGELVKTSASTSLNNAISVGSNADTESATTTTCAVTKDGSVYCWGQAGPGVINGATTSMPFATQILVASGGAPVTGVTQVTVGQTHACVLLTNGEVRCWGLADGRGIAHAYPSADSKVLGITGNVLQLSAGWGYTCALTDDSGGSVYCWGGNGGNQLGIGQGSGSSSATAVSVKTDANTLLAGVSQLSVAYGGACVVRTDHTLWCWGGSLGTGFATQMKAGTTLITDAVFVANMSNPTIPRYLSTSGAYWLGAPASTIAPNCGLEPE